MTSGGAAWFAFEACDQIKGTTCPELIKISCDHSAIGLYRFFSCGQISAAEHQLLLRMICAEEKRCMDFLSGSQILSDGYGAIYGETMNQQFFDSLND